ncbi:MAG TPA: TIM barrel protein [Candidatus Binatia bacterium]|jgi:sugar phosphate isomerase/epimerase|nr:TIM barrel protein [Candidatus Binatia bacterium]
MDRLLFATYSLRDLVTHRQWAEQYGCGLELHTFVDPAVLAGDVSGMIAAHRRLLEDFTGPLGFHGAFYDMMSGSIDAGVVELTRQRYRQNLLVAKALQGQYVVFHANYMGSFKLLNYREGWHERQVRFWRSFAEEAQDSALCVLLENMWADDPQIIADILQDIDHPNLRACLDIAHVMLYSRHTVGKWIDTLQPWLYSCHLNNTNGEHDVHWPLQQGIINYGVVLEKLRRLKEPPCMTLEMPDWSTIAESLAFFDLGGHG